MTDQTLNQNALVYNGGEIRAVGERLNLTDMWKAAGADLQKTPAKWRDLPSTKEFAEHVGLIVGKSDDEIFKVVRGGPAPRTEAHWQVGLAYAKYLSPEFHMWCNTVVRERMEGKASGVEADAELIRRTDGIARMLAHKVAGLEKAIEGIGTVSRLMAETMERKDQRIECLEQAVLETAQVVKTLVIANDPRRAVSDWIAPLDIAKRYEVPPKGRRQFCRVVGDKLAKISRSWEIPVKAEAGTGKRLFTNEVADFWIEHGGRDYITSHKAKLAGQGVLRLVPKKEG
jgi:hypothetical protein